jgi:PIN domain nuclease of toxin-antitoxin system
VMLIYSPVFFDMIPSRSVTINRSLEETYYFPLLHLICHRTANVFMLKVSVWELAVLSTQSQLNIEHSNEEFFLTVIKVI